MAEFYPKLGDVLKKQFSGWRAYLLSADMRLPKLIHLAVSKRTPLFNGALECRLFEYKMVRRRNEKEKSWSVIRPQPDYEAAFDLKRIERVERGRKQPGRLLSARALLDHRAIRNGGVLYDDDNAVLNNEAEIFPARLLHVVSVDDLHVAADASVFVDDRFLDRRVCANAQRNLSSLQGFHAFRRGLVIV